MGMAVAVDLFEPVDADVRVDLRTRETLVAEQFLDHAEVRAGVEHVGREGVPQRVRRDVPAFRQGLPGVPQATQQLFAQQGLPAGEPAFGGR